MPKHNPMAAFFAADRRPDVDISEFLVRRKERVRLLVSPRMVRLINEASGGRTGLEDLSAMAPTFVLESPAPDAPADLAGRLGPDAAGTVGIVCHETVEAEVVTRLRGLLPGIRTVSFAEVLAPALIAQAGHKIMASAPDSAVPAAPPLPSCLVCVIATPRSGSSFVCDVLADLGIGRPKEHLREPTTEFLSSGYAFNRATFFENFLRFSNTDGWSATKLITHFLYDFSQTVDTSPFIEVLRRNRIAVRPIFLDRADRVAQAVSGDLASRRRVWHVTDPAQAEALRNAPPIPYVFRRLLTRYVNYTSQGAFLETLRSMATAHLDLVYERDVQDFGRLVPLLAGFLGVSATNFKPQAAARRQKLSDLLESDHGSLFAADFQATFGKAPIVWAGPAP